nr:integrase, catalytic region, zinc finger, CCHC-type, peptidase aspartic, catalytic [Tanacetum cinerariifolium]
MVKEYAQVENDEFINIFYTPVQDRGETSSHHVDSSNMHTFYQHHPSEHRWTKDHPFEQVIGNPSQSVRTRCQLESDGEMCMFTLTCIRTRRSYFPPTSTIPRRSKKQTTIVVEPEFRNIVTMADNRTMAQMLQGPIEGYEDVIVVPQINANNFELKQTLINFVQSNQFTGRQDPHNHLRFFIKVTSTFRHPEDALDSAAGGNFLDKIPRECLSIIESKSKIAASLEEKLDIRMNRFEKSLNDMKNSFITPTAPLKAVEE